MRKPRRQASDFDSPWKESLDHFLEPFLAFFFPAIHADLNWTKGYEPLDKELHQILREADTRKRLADKLFKVWRKDGEETWLLIHIEVQGDPDANFPERMFVYNYRIYDRCNPSVVSLAVLTDDRPDWRPDEFGYGGWGYRTQIRYGVAKLLDHAREQVRLEADPNPFAAVVLAHLRALETRRDPEARRRWKTALVKGLYERGWSAEDVRQLFRIIDWMMTLPADLEQEFRGEMYRYEQERHMPYVTSIERLARQEGREEGLREGLLAGIVAGLETRFGTAGKRLLPRLRKLKDVSRLAAILESIPRAATLEEIRNALR
jgi:hypothetical protein